MPLAVCTVNPASAAAPPEADTAPSILNWKPLIASLKLYRTSTYEDCGSCTAHSQFKVVPPGAEKTNSDKEDSEQSPPKLTRVPLPVGIVAPEKEKAKTTPLLADTVKPFAAASPPEAPLAQPS